jgi:Tfp pilus assembly protein PilV
VKQRRSGFSLAEVVMAMFILLCGFLVVAKVSPGGTQGVAMTRDQLLAERIARNLIERVRSAPFQQTDFSSLQGPLTMSNEVTEGRKMGLEFAVKSVTVNQPASPGGGGAVATPTFGDITVTIEWRAIGGTENSAGNKTFTLTGGRMRDP